MSLWLAMQSPEFLLTAGANLGFAVGGLFGFVCGVVGSSEPRGGRRG
jgi:hypothetical protein